MENLEAEIKSFVGLNGGEWMTAFLDTLLDPERRQWAKPAFNPLTFLQRAYEAVIHLQERAEEGALYRAPLDAVKEKIVEESAKHYRHDSGFVEKMLDEHLKKIVEAWKQHRMREQQSSVAPSEAVSSAPVQPYLIRVRPMKKEDRQAVIAIEREKACNPLIEENSGPYISRTLVAEYGRDGIAGFMICTPHMGQKQIRSYAVAGWAEGKGVDAELGKRVIDSVSEDPYRNEVIVAVFADDTHAQKLYRGLGFVAKYVVPKGPLATDGEKYIMCCRVKPVVLKGEIEAGPIEKIFPKAQPLKASESVDLQRKDVNGGGVNITIKSLGADISKVTDFKVTVEGLDSTAPEIIHIQTSLRISEVVQAIREAIPRPDITALEAVRAIAGVKERLESRASRSKTSHH